MGMEVFKMENCYYSYFLTENECSIQDFYLHLLMNP